MLRNRLFNYSIYLNYLSKDNCIFIKAVQNSSRIIFANISRIRNIEIERYLYHNFKYKFNEKKSKYASTIGRFLLGATILSFAEDKISDEEIQEHFDEFCTGLVNANCKSPIKERKTPSAITAKPKKPRISAFGDTRHLMIRSPMISDTPNMPMNSLSQLTDKKLSTDNPEGFIDASWSQLINSKTVKLWRRPLPTNPKVFEYRLCGTFDDVSAHCFYRVQTDIEYRKQWDDLIVDLRVLRTDSETDTETIRWVTHYPYPMNDREYIFKRRAYRFSDNNSAIIVSKAIDGNVYHTERNSSVRIVDYKSIMYIQSHSSFDEMGMDYFLIYYDDPKTNFPNAAVSWMSTAGIPGFMEKVHKASMMLEQQVLDKKPENLSAEQVLVHEFEELPKAHEDNSNRIPNKEPFYSHFSNAFAAMDFNFAQSNNSK